MKKKNICSKNNTSISLKSVNKEENKKNINSLLEKKKEKILKSNILNKKNILRIKKKDSKNLESKKKRKKKNFNQLTNNYKENTNINKNKKNIKNNKKKKIFISKNSEKRFFSNKKRISKTKIYNSKLQQKFVKPSKILNKKIIIGDFISVVNLSKKMAIKSSKVIKNLLNLGISATSEKILDQDTAQLVSEDMGYQVFLHQENMLEVSLMKNRNLNISKKKKRPPIVTIMGHVDHGKTSLLDYIRSSKIASKEKGGITQHIGAYHVNTKKGTITFLDTPGHSAFTAMRARGTNVTDIVVLVVAADDGVMPQTIEAIQHAQNAKVPIIVAINKIDKTKNNLEIIKKELIKYSIIPEEFGGENIFVLVSAKTGFGIDNLLSNILLQAEILELKSSYTSMAEGIVIESYLDKQCGPVATIIISEGILHINDIVICGLEYGKIKLLKNEYDKDVLSASPSIPIKVFGLSGVPNTGDLFTVVNNEKKARAVSIYRRKKLRELKFSNQKKTTIDHLFDNINIKNQSSINIILKTDFQGSLEAILDSLKLLSDKSIKINIIMSGVGAITETDVSLSMTTTSILIGFNIRADFSARKIIELENLDIRYYSIIHDLINDIKNIKLGLLTPKNKNKIIGLAEVRNIFKSPKFGLIAGCMVIEGIIKKNNPIRILRNNIVIYEGELESLRHFKEDVLEVRRGMECGIGIKNYNDIKISDIIELFQIIK